MSQIENTEEFNFLKEKYSENVSFSAWIQGITEEFGVANIRTENHPGYESIYPWQDWSNGDQVSGYAPEFSISESSFIRRGDSAYVIVEGPTWQQAEANANKLGGHLVTINNEAEHNWLDKNFTDDY